MFFSRYTKKFCLSTIIVMTMMTCIICICHNKANAYEVYMNGKFIAYVKDKDTVKDINRNIENEIKNRFGNIKIDNKFMFSRIILDEKNLTNSDLIRKSIINNVNNELDVCILKSDQKEIGLVANSKECNKVIDLLKAYYIQKNNLSLKECNLKNKITYSRKKAKFSEIKPLDELVTKIIEVNEKNPLISFEFKGTQEIKADIEPSVVINWSEELLKGESVVNSEGEKGQKLVNKSVTMENCKVISESILDESVIIEAKDKLVVQGTKNPIIAQMSALNMPSRGSISSGFGMRWGRMHEGVDIAASMGSPITAALDGTVNYAGVEEGYGNTIKISHSNGIETIYGHCSSILVKSGQQIKKGEKIGLVGSTGNSTGPHVHFEVRIDGKPQNPLQYLK